MADDDFSLIDESGRRLTPEAIKAAADATKELDKAQESAAKTGQTLATAFTSLTDSATTFQGVGVTLISQTAEVAQGFLDVVNPLNILGNAVNQVVSQTRALIAAQDQAITSFNLATGAARLYGEEIVELRNQMFMQGVGAAEAGAAYGDLVTQVTDLRHMTSESRAELAQTAAILQQIGVDASITAASFQFLTKSMGLSAAEASEFSREMFVLAQSIGMPPEAMAQAFVQAQGDLAVFGAEATDVFKDIQRNARAAGMEVDELLSITQKFDTFEGAADAVGRLNAILGGPFLNSMQMVQTTDPTERMRLLSDAISSAGLSFEEMGYYQRIALAEAGGFKDVEELALVMKGGFDEANDAVSQTDSSLEAMQAAQAEFVTLSEQMADMMGYFAYSVYPLVKALGLLLSGINFIVGGLYSLEVAGLNIGRIILPTLTLAAGAYFFANTSLLGTVTALASGLKAMAASALAAIPSVGSLGKSTAAAGGAAGGGATGFLMAGAAIALMGAGALAAGAGVYLVGQGLSMIFETLLSQGLDGIMALNQLGSSMAMLTVASLGLGFALPSLAKLVGVINSLEENKVVPFASLFESINSILDKDMQNLLIMQKSVDHIVNSINSIDDTTKVMEVRKLIQQMNAAASPAAGATASSTGAGSSPLSQPLNVSLKMNNREMGTWAYNTVADFLNMGRSN